MTKNSKVERNELAMADYHILPNESEEEYIVRVCSNKEQIGTWQDVCDILNKELGYDYSESKYRKASQCYTKYLNANLKNIVTDDEYLSRLEESKRELEKQTVKFRDMRNEYNRYLRSDTRDEVFIESVIEAIKNSELPKPPNSFIPVEENDIVWLFSLADSHYGAEFKINGINGEVLSEYSPEIFESQMWAMQRELLFHIKKNNIKVLNIMDFADCLDGVLRVSQLMRIRYGLADQIVYYSRFITSWLNELSKYVHIKYQLTTGNHDEIRNAFGKEGKGMVQGNSMDKIIKELIRVSLANNPNFELIETGCDLMYLDAFGKNIVGFHGETKNMENTLKNFTNIYKVNIDYLMAGHKHHIETKEIAKGKHIINLPSIVSFDPYALSLEATSTPSVKLFGFTANGLSSEETFYLE